MDGAKQFFHQAVETAGHPPDRVTTDGHDAYPRAIHETVGEDVVHRTSPYLNNRLEKITVASNNAITQCAGSGTSPPPLASAAPSMNSANTSGCAPRCVSPFLR
jgi:hypothetical protein